MTKRNALIFSKNNTISRIVLAELSFLGYTPKIVQEIPEQKDTEIIVFDATELELSQSIRSFIASSVCTKKIAIMGNPSGKLSARFHKTLVFPFLLSDFRDIILETSEQYNSDKAGGSATSKLFIASKDKKGVTLDDLFIPLSQYEFSLLNLLCENSGNCVSREDILNLFDSGDSNIAEVYICHLRNKLETPFGIKVIYTVRGKGYMTDYAII